MQLVFGIGALWATRTDVAGVGPQQFAILQENSIDFSFEIKELYSQYGFPVDIARAKGKITGKAKFARVFGALYANIFFGENNPTSGETTVSQDELATITTGNAAALAVSITGTAWVADLGVYYNTSSRIRFVYTTGTPTAAGQYTSLGGGTYKFYTGDVGQVIAISYVYTDATGFNFTINNHFMGFTPTFSCTLYQNRTTLGGVGKLTLRLNECTSNRFSLPSRLDDYAIPDFDFSAFADGTNTVGTLSTTE